MHWTVYLSGEIHTDWREQLAQDAAGVPVSFTSAVTDHAASDAGYLAAPGKPYITLHDEDIIHSLKEVDAAAMAWAQTPEDVVKILKYVTQA